MTKLDAHGKLLSLLCLLLVAAAGPAILSACSGLFPEGPKMGWLGGDQAAQAFDRIVPGLTRADDLPALGFDARAPHTDILSYREVQARILPAHPDAAVKACIRAGMFCTGMVFHPADARVTLLVMNGRVVHKVLAS